MATAESAKTLIIIPTYNEAENLESLVTEVTERALPEAHILVVDDNSPDGTGGIADRLAAADERVHVLHREGKLGFGSAYKMAFKWGMEHGYEILVQMDADFSHDPKYLRPFYEQALNSDVDVVVGSRYVPGGGTKNWGVIRRFVSRGGGVYARFWLGVELRDVTGGFNFWKPHVLKGIDYESIKSEGYCFQIELKFRSWRSNFNLLEMPIVFEDRKLGNSKMSPRIFREAMVRVATMGVKERLGFGS